jgi:Methyltransferase domain
VTEWKLFDGPPPGYTACQFFSAHPWVPPAHQAGHADRMTMATGLIREAVAAYGPATLSDLGCGDGSLLTLLDDLPLRMWGYDIGGQNVTIAQFKGLDVRQADILGDGLEYGELITCCEVIEHLADPHGFIRSLPGRLLVLTSPSAETAAWHYEHHAWAWDTAGYAAMITAAGWTVASQAECDGGLNYHDGITQPQRFQAVFATREQPS